MAWLLATVSILTTMANDPILAVTPGTPRVQQLAGRAIGNVSFDLILDNRSDQPLPVTARPAVLRHIGAVLARCPYERAIMVETAGERRKFTPFVGPLAPREQVSVRFFFRCPKGTTVPDTGSRSETPPFVLELSLVATGGDGEDVETTVTSRPFAAEKLDGI